MIAIINAAFRWKLVHSNHQVKVCGEIIIFDVSMILDTIEKGVVAFFRLSTL